MINSTTGKYILLSSFDLNGHTLGFYPQTKKLDLLIRRDKQYQRKILHPLTKNATLDF